MWNLTSPHQNYSKHTTTTLRHEGGFSLCAGLDPLWIDISISFSLNPLRTNSDLSQTSHCNIKGLSVREVVRIENMITQV